MDSDPGKLPAIELVDCGTVFTDSPRVIEQAERERAAADLFVPLHARSARVRCRICNRIGMPTSGRGWQLACLRGHGPCPDCGHQNALRKDGTARRCVGRGARQRHNVGSN